jgi:hypothetical protein
MLHAAGLTCCGPFLVSTEARIVKPFRLRSLTRRGFLFVARRTGLRCERQNGRPVRWQVLPQPLRDSPQPPGLSSWRACSHLATLTVPSLELTLVDQSAERPLAPRVAVHQAADHPEHTAPGQPCRPSSESQASALEQLDDAFKNVRLAHANVLRDCRGHRAIMRGICQDRACVS